MTSYALVSTSAVEFELDNPSLPLVKRIDVDEGNSTCLRVGSCVTIYGHVKMFASRFTVDLLAVDDKYNRNASLPAAAIQTLDIALRVCAQWNGGDKTCVRKNSRVASKWGVEDSDPVGRNPFDRMTKFKLDIHVDESLYRIVVNERHFSEFAHRIPIQRVNGIAVAGDVSIYSIIFTHDSEPASVSASDSDRED